MISGRWMGLFIGVLTVMAGSQFVVGEWSVGSAWLSAAIWAGVAHTAMRFAEKQRDALNMLRELAQLPAGEYVVVEADTGRFITGKYVKRAP